MTAPGGARREKAGGVLTWRVGEKAVGRKNKVNREYREPQQRRILKYRNPKRCHGFNALVWYTAGCQPCGKGRKGEEKKRGGKIRQKGKKKKSELFYARRQERRLPCAH